MDETTTQRPTGTAPGQARDLTPQQRMVTKLITGIANDLDRGTRDEQHTAALLHQVADAISRGYEAEMVALVRGWRLEREAQR